MRPLHATVCLLAGRRGDRRDGGCARPADGPDFQIGADLGTLAGRNLFRSFEPFSLDAGERASVSGPDEIRSMISRVTSGTRSEIEGALRSTIPGADFYFLNPAGIAFGPTPRLVDARDDAPGLL